MTGVNIEKNSFSMLQKFDYPMATVAMRVPYMPKYEQAFINKIENAHLPGITVHAIGNSTLGRPLSVIQVDDPDSTATDTARPVILLYGDEDGNEPDGAWVVDGALRWLLSTTPEVQHLRQRVTFLLIPQFDPDGFAAGSYAHLTKTFVLPDLQKRIFLRKRWLMPLL